MSYGDQIRHPDGALHPQPEGRVRWWWVLVAAGVALVLVAVFRPQWLARVGVHVNLSSAGKALGSAANSMGWV